MSKKETITVIVPCYNVEKYLRRCLDSLLTQTFKNLEIIMVEDCSTDGTKKIVREYEKQYPNFRAIYNEENGGLGHARNVGIEATTSKYIGFLDSDDWLPNNFYEEMFGVLSSSSADMSICDIYLRYDDTKRDERVRSYNGRPDKIGFMNTGMAATSSDKLFKTELFKNIRYPEDIVNEDIPVVLAILYRSKVIYTGKTYYNYYQRPGSIQNSEITSKRFDIFRAVDLLKHNIDSQIDKKIWQVIIWHQIIAVFIYVVPRERNFTKRKKLIEEFYALTKKYKINITSNAGLREFMKENRPNRLYAKKLFRLLEKKRFASCSSWMGFFSLYMNNKDRILVKAAKMLIFHPRQFLQTSWSALRRHFVIKSDVTMRDLVACAKSQNKLSGNNLVSVVIPNYNYERFLLQRVYSILSQTEKIGEIIILDDNSSDDSVKLAETIRKQIDKLIPIRLINNTKNQGTFRQWERGFKEAKYDLIWIAEADDYCDSALLHYIMKPIAKDEDVLISYANTGYADATGLLMGNVKNDIDVQHSGHWDRSYVSSGLDEAMNYAYLNNTIANVSSVLFRKKKNVNYSELFKNARKYRQVGDWVLYVNYMILGKVAYTDRVLNYYRIHGENVSSTVKKLDHIKELKEVHEMFTVKLNLDNKRKKRMIEREKFLKKVWNI